MGIKQFSAEKLMKNEKQTTPTPVSGCVLSVFHLSFVGTIRKQGTAPL
jgi:hypothetical protein